MRSIYDNTDYKLTMNNIQQLKVAILTMTGGDPTPDITRRLTSINRAIEKVLLWLSNEYKNIT